MEGNEKWWSLSLSRTRGSVCKRRGQPDQLLSGIFATPVLKVEALVDVHLNSWNNGLVKHQIADRSYVYLKAILKPTNMRTK